MAVPPPFPVFFRKNTIPEKDGAGEGKKW